MDEQKGLRIGWARHRFAYNQISLLKAPHCTGVCSLLRTVILTDPKVQPLVCIPISHRHTGVWKDSWTEQRKLKPSPKVSPAPRSLLVECIYSRRDTSGAESSCGG